MAQGIPDGGRQDLAITLEQAGSKAFDPSGTDASRAEGQREFGDLISRTRTLGLMSALNSLIKPDRVPRWLRLPLMDVLTLLPQRPDGVRATLEFVFAVHPSSAMRASEAAEPKKQGANITMEALKMAATLLSVPPASVPPENWFPGIAPQLLALLDGNDGPDLVKVASYVIGFGVLGRRQLGAPGSPGWKAFAEPLLSRINPSLVSAAAPDSKPLVFSAGPDEVIDLHKDAVLVSSNDLSQALRRLNSLLESHPNPGLSKRLINPLIPSLWTLCSWPHATEQLETKFCTPSKKLLQIFLKISSSPDTLLLLVKRLQGNGNQDSTKGVKWKYVSEGDGELDIRTSKIDVNVGAGLLDLETLQLKVNAFVDLLQAACSKTDISQLFLELFKRTLSSQRSDDGIKIKLEEPLTDDQDGSEQLLQVSLLSRMMEKLPESLIDQWQQLMEVVAEILADASYDAEAIQLALSLSNQIITAPDFETSKLFPDTLRSLERSLGRLGKSEDRDVATTARNIGLLLKYRDQLHDPTETDTIPTDRQVEERKTYSLAMSYITQTDSPAPVRSEGLNLLSGLIQSNSSILDVQSTLIMLSSLLSDDDEYITLRVMKLFTQMAQKHPKSVVKELLDHYIDANEEAPVDTRLRFGEALLQVTQRLGDTYAGDIASQISQSLLATAGRRGHRPKTEAKQERDERLRQRQQKAANEAWEGEVPDISEDPDETEEEKARNAILAQIISGWESKRGTEDIRIRASALSIFSIGLETNVAGIGAGTVEAAVDLCISILTLESEMEKAILRRSAIILILTFVRALADAKENQRRLGFGLTDQAREDILRVLNYIAGTDNDGLVQQHAKDVVESLENWQMTSMLPEIRNDNPALSRLAGLDVGNPILRAQQPQVRPKIEEIE